MRRRRLPLKQVRKHFDGCCFICGEPDYDLLDAHRVLAGRDGGTYHWENILTLCATCHRKVESGRLLIHGRHPSSLGVPFIHYTHDGQEYWEREDRWRHER